MLIFPLRRMPSRTLSKLAAEGFASKEEARDVLNGDLIQVESGIVKMCPIPRVKHQ